jgi:hypothetical protein
MKTSGVLNLWIASSYCIILTHVYVTMHYLIKIQ